MADGSSKFVIPTPKTLPYKSFLIKLSRKFKEEDVLSELKFALKGVIPEGKLERINDPLQVFSTLEHRCLLGPDNVDVLRRCLKAIGRPNLIKIMDEYENVDSKLPLELIDGCRVSIKEGSHSCISQGEFVEVRCGSDGSLTIANQHSTRCKVNALINGYKISNSLLPEQTMLIERPSIIAEKCKFFAFPNAPLALEDPGLIKWCKNDSGLIQVKFNPQQTGLKITCVASDAGECQIIYCAMEVNSEVEYSPTQDSLDRFYEAFMRETEGLIHNYIGLCLVPVPVSRFKLPFLHGIPCQFFAPPNHLSDKANILRTLAMNAKRENRQLFQEIRHSLGGSGCHMKANLQMIAEIMFSDKVNWGRIVILITITGVMAHHVAEQECPEMVFEVIQWLLQFIRLHLVAWMIRNGGWDGFLYHFGRNK